MRWLLLIMTGIGFTLGLLCGLLLHLPALDGLPASGLDNSAVADDAYRSRRSLSNNEVDYNKHLARPAVGGGGEEKREGKSSFQSPPNPEIAPNPFVSGGGQGPSGHNEGVRTHSGVNGQRVGQAESQGENGAGEAQRKSVHDEGDEKSQSQSQAQPRDSHSSVGGAGSSGGSSDSDAPPAPPATAIPVTSFTLRLKKSGDKVVVVDSKLGEQDRERNSQKDMSRTATQQQINKDNTNDQHSDSLLFKDSKHSTDVLTGVLWSQRLEDSCSGKRDAPEELGLWRQKAVGMQVVSVEEGCGRMQNRLVTFKDGSKACARYRLNTDQIQGEVYSYYLAQLLNMTRYLPPALIVPVDTLSHQWRAVHLQVSMAQWADGRLVVLTRWLPDLSPSHIPAELREDDRKLHPVLQGKGGLENKTHPELCDLLQWSDLIVFDYLTANLDRLVNNMFNKQWNAEMMNNPAHNLERTKTGNLVFLDNESGLFHGYRLLDKYKGYHDTLLNSLCVFRGSTARAVKRLHKNGDVGFHLERVLKESEEHHRHLPPMPEKNVSVLKDRLTKVYEQIVKCEALYGVSDISGGGGDSGDSSSGGSRTHGGVVDSQQQRTARGDDSNNDGGDKR